MQTHIISFTYIQFLDPRSYVIPPFSSLVFHGILINLLHSGPLSLFLLNMRVILGARPCACANDPVTVRQGIVKEAV